MAHYVEKSDKNFLGLVRLTVFGCVSVTIIAIAAIYNAELLTRSKITMLESRIQQLEKDVAEAQWDAMWAQNLLVTGMDSVGDEIRRINKKVGMSPWGWSARE